jgi:hypothetical protein
MNGKLTSGDLADLTRDTTRLEESYELQSKISMLRNGPRGALNISLGINGAHGPSALTPIPNATIQTLTDAEFNTILTILVEAQDRIIDANILLIKDRYGVVIEG